MRQPRGTVAGSRSQLQSGHGQLALPALWSTAARDGAVLGLPSFNDLVCHLPPLPKGRRGPDRLLRPGQAADASHGLGRAPVLGAISGRSPLRHRPRVRKRSGRGVCSGTVGSSDYGGGAARQGRPKPRHVVRSGLDGGREENLEPARKFCSGSAVGRGSGPSRHQRLAPRDKGQTGVAAAAGARSQPRTVRE